MNDPIVVDLSHWNPEPDWPALKAGGVIGVIHKATEDTSYVDPTLFTRMGRAKKAGLLTATYHFMRPGEIEAQMDHYLGTIDPVQGERVVLDHEDAGVSVEDLAYAVAHVLEKRPDVEVTIYSGHLIKEQLGSGKNDYLAKNTSLWIAQYTTASAPSWPTATWPAWSLWQYTDAATVEGISAGVDGNRWNGNEASLRAWLSPAGQVPAPTPDPTPDPSPLYRIVISCPVGVEVDIVTQPEGYPLMIEVADERWGPI